MPTLLTLALLSADVYQDNAGAAVAGYRRLTPTPAMRACNTRPSSFFGAAYAGGEDGVIAFRGSAERTDWLDADVDIGMGRMPIDQWGDAMAFFNAARGELTARGCTRLAVTGHSLGGGLTQLVAAGITRTPVVGVTFNAPGMGNLAGPVQLRRDNAANLHHYRARNDPVSRVGAHIGRAPVSVDVSLGLKGAFTVGAARGLGMVAGPLGSQAAGSAAQAGLEHTLGPLIEALRDPALGGRRF